MKRWYRREGEGLIMKKREEGRYRGVSKKEKKLLSSSFSTKRSLVITSRQ